MAEIHVQIKRRIPSWVWIVVVLLIIGAAAAIIVMKNKNKNTTEQNRSATYEQPVTALPYHLV